MARQAFADDFQPDFGLPWVPVLPNSHWDNRSIDEVAAYVKLRQECEARAIANPIACGWTIPMWQEVMANWRKYHTHIILGGNRASKSELAARLCVWAACSIPNAEVRAMHVNKDRSVEDQQRAVWLSIPEAIKNLPTKKGINHNLQFSQKNGFTDDICIFPPLPGAQRGGYIKFNNYAQYSQDEKMAEGFKSHVIWADEEIPLKLFQTLNYRTSDYHGRIILTFTTINGWTPLVQQLLGNVKTLRSAPAPLLGGVPVPLIQESTKWPGMCIYYFHTEANPFIDVQDFSDKIRGKPRDEIMARAYGIPTKSLTSVFPGFNREVNVIPHEKLPWLDANLKTDKNGDKVEYAVTRYMSIDPAGSKNWFMLWVAIDAAGTYWVYREWPDYDNWAEPGANAEGRPGPAQKGSKKGIRDYVEIIRAAEESETIYERFIDPRMGAAERQSDEGATTIISDLDDQNLLVIPAPGVDIDNGLQMINNLLSYDEKKPMDSLNSPHLFISDRCQNLIYAMQEYTAKGGKDEATKDPVDALRYICVSNPEFYDKLDMQGSAQTFSY